MHSSTSNNLKDVVSQADSIKKISTPCELINKSFTKFIESHNSALFYSNLYNLIKIGLCSEDDLEVKNSTFLLMRIVLYITQNEIQVQKDWNSITENTKNGILNQNKKPPMNYLIDEDFKDYFNETELIDDWTWLKDSSDWQLFFNYLETIQDTAIHLITVIQNKLMYSQYFIHLTHC